MATDTTRLSFPGTSGHQLAARLHLPVGEPVAYALLAHCFTCSKDLRSLVHLSAALAESGVAVLRFDFTGLGESEGDFAETHFSSNLDDLVAAADYLREHHRAPRLLIGHSLGGAAVLGAAHRIPEAVAVATIGAPSDPTHLRQGLLADVDPQAEESEVVLAGRSFRVRRELFEDLEQHALLEKVTTLDRALLVMHSPVDEVVDVDHARRLYEAARHPKSFLSLDGADHLLLADRADARWAGEILATWARRYLGAEGAQSAQGAERAQSAERAESAETAPEEPLPPGVVEVVGGRERYRQTVRSRGHVLVADEPEAAGGADTGPTPYGLLLAALGSCINITLRMYADRKQMPLDGVRVRLRHSKVHATDCEECETSEGKIDLIEKHLVLEGEQLSEEQRERLVQISAMCPVHRSLTSETVVRSVESFE